MKPFIQVGDTVRYISSNLPFSGRRGVVVRMDPQGWWADVQWGLVGAEVKRTAITAITHAPAQPGREARP